MKLAKTKLLLGLLLGVTIVTSSVAPFLSAPKAAAAPSFVDSGGHTSTPYEGRFIFLSPMQIEDTVTNSYYYVKSTACNQDGIFSCGASNPGGYADTFREEDQDTGHGDSYWFWPSSDGSAVTTPTNNVCKSALVLGIPISGDAAVGERIQGVHLSVVNPTPVAGNKCAVEDGDGRNVPTQDIEGYGIAAGKFAWVQNYNSANDGYRPNNNDYCEDTADTVNSHCLVKSSQVAVTDLTSRNGSAQDQQTLVGLGTIFHWSGKTQLTSYLDDNYSSTPVTDQASINNIVSGLKNGANSNTKSFADPSKYDYYSNSRCISNNSYKAVIVIAKTDPYHATIVHRLNGDTSKGFIDDWTHSDNSGGGSEPSVQADCLYSGDDLARSIPSEVWMDPKHQTYTAYIGLADVQIQQGSTTPVAGGSQGSGSADGAGSSPEINCSVSLFNPLSWFLCPLATALEAVVTGLDNEINNYLDIAPGKSSYDANQCNLSDRWCGYYQAWSVVRNVSLGLIAVFALVAIVSQAMGLEMFDAYTVRKVLPRLLVAAIGITLSWPLMMWFIQFTDDLGIGIRQLIYAPFSHYKVALGGGGQFVSSFFVGGAIVALGFAGLLSFVATAALAAAVAFLVLTLRQMLIVMLVIFAPIAIACYVLPNTQKGWKLWSDSFGKALMMFPLIAAFIAIGRVFAAVNTNQTGSINQIIAFTAYFAPYFLIPFTFRLAGGALGTLAGAVNDRGRGVFDRLKKQRQGIMADRFQRAQSNQLWDPSSRVGKVGNKMASWATDPLNNAAYYGRNTVPGLRKRGHKVATHIEHAQVEQSGKLFEELNKMGYNDKAYRALSGSLGEKGKDFSNETWDALNDLGPIDSLAKMQQASEILSRGSESEQLAGNAIHGSMGRLATLYQDPEMGKASIGAAGIMGLAAHGFASASDLADAGNNLQAQGGASYAQSVVSQAQLLGSRSRPDTKPGYGVMYDSQSGKFVDATQPGGTRARAVVKSLSSHDLAGAKGGAFDTLAPTMQQMLGEGGNEAKAVEDQLFSWSGPYSQASVDIKAKSLEFMQNNSARAMRTKVRRDEDGKAVRDAAGNAVTYQEEGWAEGSLMDKFEKYSRAETNPETRGGAGGQPDEGGAPGGPGGQ